MSESHDPLGLLAAGEGRLVTATGENGSSLGDIPGENGETKVTSSPTSPPLSEASSPTSPISPGLSLREHPYPKDSIIEDFMAVGRKVSEAPDSFTLAPLMALIGHLMIPAVYIDFAGRKYPNLFQFVVGLAGVKKSTSFKITQLVARKLAS